MSWSFSARTLSAFLQIFFLECNITSGLHVILKSHEDPHVYVSFKSVFLLEFTDIIPPDMMQGSVSHPKKPWRKQKAFQKLRLIA